MPTPIIPAELKTAAMVAELLREGKIVALPTETVYGLAADACQSEAITKIYQAKNRPRFNPLIAHINSLDMAYAYAIFSESAQLLAKAFWPGALTLVLPQKTPSPLSPLAFAGKPSVALRMPDSPFTLKVIEHLGHPIVAPSANISGHVSPTTAAHVIADLNGKVDAICDGGQCKMGVESTIVKIDGDDVTLLRHGMITSHMIEAVLGRSIALHNSNRDDDTAPQAPGMMLSHYAPKCGVRLNATHILPDEAFLGFGNFIPEGILNTTLQLNLSPSANVEEAAYHLYDYLRTLDGTSPKGIAIAPIPDTVEFGALNDRLKRASTPPNTTNE